MKLNIETRLGLRLRELLPLWLAEFVLFVGKLAWASIFAGLLLTAIIATKVYYPDVTVARYDFLLIFAVTIQILMIALKLETWAEVRVILLFHISGTIMEVFKLAQGSWDYPDQGFFEIGGVPMFSGFMYASVGSFMARTIRVFDMRFTPFPHIWMGSVLATAIYINFFTHHYTVDIRWVLMIATIILFGRTVIHFQPMARQWHMPMVIAAGLSSLFLYIAENIGTLTGTWVYGGTEISNFTDPAKITSWYLLLYVSFMQVIIVHRHVTKSLPKTP